MERMKIGTIGLTLAFCFLGAAACFAADPQMGTWKLNEAKSKITPGTLKNTQVVYSSMLGQVKIKADGIDANTKVNDRTLTTTNKKNGKVTVTGQIVVSSDGKSRTVTISGNTPKGKKFQNVAVYDKQ